MRGQEVQEEIRQLGDKIRPEKGQFEKIRQPGEIRSASRWSKKVRQLGENREDQTERSDCLGEKNV